MAPPTKLAIATSSVQRLVKEEASYHKEQDQQQARIEKLKQDTSDENAEYLLKQEHQALEETKKVIPRLRQQIKDALTQLEAQLEENKDAGGEASTNEVTQAKEVVAAAKRAIRES